MTDRTRDQIADQINELRARSTAAVKGTIAQGANPHQDATFTYQVNGQTKTAIGEAFTMCPPGEVSALKLSDGSWALFSDRYANPAQTTLHESRRRRQVPVSIGKVKILYLRTENGIDSYYVGGDRLTPRKVHLAPVSNRDFIFGRINNLGGDRYTIQLTYQNVGTEIVTIRGASKEILRELDDPRIRIFNGAVGRQLGYGFWGSTVVFESSSGVWSQDPNLSGVGANLAIWKGDVLSADATGVFGNVGGVQTYNLDGNWWMYPTKTIGGHSNFNGSTFDQDYFEGITMDQSATRAISYRYHKLGASGDPPFDTQGVYFVDNTHQLKLTGTNLDLLPLATDFTGNLVSFASYTPGQQKATVYSWVLNGSQAIANPDRQEKVYRIHPDAYILATSYAK